MEMVTTYMNKEVLQTQYIDKIDILLSSDQL